MAATKFEERLKKIQSGRGYSPAYIREEILKFASEEFEDLLDLGNGDEYFVESTASDIRKLIFANKDTRTYGQIAEKIYSKVSEKMMIQDELTIMMAFLSVNPRFRSFFELPVIDYLSAAGVSEGYDTWFLNDVEAWERDHGGMTPTLKDVLKSSMDIIMSKSQSWVGLDIVIARMSAPQRGTSLISGFSRRSGERGEKVEPYLAAGWIWILMIEIPLMIMGKADGKEGYLSATILR